MSNPMNFAFLRKEALPPNGRKVAIIGAGPSGLAASGYLACLGYEVVVYDKLPQPGGLMVFGIPKKRIPPERIQAGVKRMERQFGVLFRTKTKICCSAPLHEEEGDHFSCDIRGLGELVREYDAIMICTGSWKSRKLGIPGEKLKGVHSGLEFLFPIRAARYASPNVSMPAVQGKRVAVVGAGHSAVDVVDSAHALGAEKVYMIYRRTVREAPCGSYEIDRIEEMGATWLERRTPLSVMGDDSVVGLELANGVTGETETLDVDMVVTAIGEIPTPPFQQELGLENVRKGEVRWLHMTSIDNVFVAGDVLTGPSKIGKAIYSGLRASRSLTNWLDLKAQDREDEYNYDEDKIDR
ncbi:FAD-dependent oxidoreductase [Oleidesulfovibrio sp.]|uniref:FAD-dependent oxidoreductase n=1 Tax=Oleidesulfovibrio sp. TaxID=2909707 RepID=UPI003A8C7E9D